jgi:helix-turn-helix resolvase-like protein/resolvase-like protein
MRQKSVSTAGTPEKLVRDIRRATRKQYSAEEKDPHCAGRTARRGEHLGAVPPGRHCRLDVLRLVEGVPGGRQAPAGGRHRPRRDVRRGEVPKCFLDMLGVFAEFETNLRKERQLEGIAKAKSEGKYKGRPASIDPERIRQLKAEGMGPTKIADVLGIGRASVYRALGAETV